MKRGHYIPSMLLVFFALSLFSCQKNKVTLNDHSDIYPYNIITKHACLGTWQTLHDSSILNGGTIITVFPLLTITVTEGEIYTPITDTVAPMATVHVICSMIDSSEISIYNSGGTFWGGPDPIDSTKSIINVYTATIFNHIFKHN